jgi:uncharacterized protein (TIGR02145 family)
MQIANPSCSFTGNCPNAGPKLKAKSGWNNNTNNTDDYDFTALPGGYGSGGNFADVRNSGFWWSITEGDASHVYIRRMLFNRDYVYQDNYDKTDLFSVRCVKD